MKFEKQLSKNRVEIWADFYIHYEQLKKYLKKMNHLQSQTQYGMRGHTKCLKCEVLVPLELQQIHLEFHTRETGNQAYQSFVIDQVFGEQPLTASSSHLSKPVHRFWGLLKTDMDLVNKWWVWLWHSSPFPSTFGISKVTEIISTKRKVLFYCFACGFGQFSLYISFVSMFGSGKSFTLLIFSFSTTIRALSCDRTKSFFLSVELFYFGL